MTVDRPKSPPERFAAEPDRSERILFFLTVGAFLVVALIVLIVLLI